MKKAIITGGYRGIGRGVAETLAVRGYDTVITFRNDAEKADRTAAEITEKSGRYCKALHADFSDPLAIKATVRDGIELLGGLDLLVNNAATTGSYYELLDMSDEYILSMMNVNFCSAAIGIREAAMYMAKNGIRGSIVNISSVRGQDHSAFPEDAIYGAAKAGMDRAIQSFALCLAPYGIRINNVAPGAILNKTFAEAEAMGADMTAYAYRNKVTSRKIPLERLGMPEDIGHAVAFLASEEASYITGVTLVVDGGLTLPGMPERKRPADAEDRGWGYVHKKF